MYSYAQDDWASVADKLNFVGVNKVVDVGGGFGFLAQAIQQKHSHIECVVLEMPDVVESFQKYPILILIFKTEFDFLYVHCRRQVRQD